MSLGSSLSGISFSGLSSGMDTQGIIDRLLQLEALPAQRYTATQNSLNVRRDALNALKTQVTAISAAASALNSASAFNPISASSSKTDVATITAGSDSVAGSYQLEVSKLAQAHKIGTSAQASLDAPLAMTGKLTVNGKGVTVESGDSLRTLAQKINGAGAGVVASLIDGGSGSAYLSLTASATGAAKAIQIGDLDGTVAQSLGLANGSLSFRQPVTGGGQSAAFSSNTSSVGSLLGFTGLGSQTFQLNGQAVNVDLDSTSLQGVADAINASGSGASATVKSVTEDGKTVYKLEVSGVTTFDDADGVLQGLGVLQRGYGNSLVEAQDAAFELDGVALTSATNTLTTVVPGATITLLKANITTPETSTLTLSRDNSAIKGKVKDFMNAFNAMVDFVKANSELDSETFATGVLFGDSVTQQIESSLSNLMFQSVPGAGTYQNLAQLGFGFDEDGKLELNEATLDAALTSDASAVGQLFRAYGSSANTNLSMVAAGSKAKSSTTAGYSIEITQAALQHSMRAEVAQAGPLAQQEALTFSGSQFGSSNVILVLEAGLTQAQVADKINTDSRLKDLVTATIDSGQLVLTSKRYGVSSTFSVSSDEGTGGTGWGTATTLSTGTDIAGTINGEAATGSGQILTGNAGNANTDGLQILYKGTATGVVGTLNYSRGLAPQTSDLISTYTDTVNGLFSSSDQSIADQLKSVEDSLNALDERIARQREMLTFKFTKMEEAISRLQSQQAQLGTIFAQQSTAR